MLKNGSCRNKRKLRTPRKLCLITEPAYSACEDASGASGGGGVGSGASGDGMDVDEATAAAADDTLDQGSIWAATSLRMSFNHRNSKAASTDQASGLGSIDFVTASLSPSPSCSPSPQSDLLSSSPPTVARMKMDSTSAFSNQSSPKSSKLDSGRVCFDLVYRKLQTQTLDGIKERSKSSLAKTGSLEEAGTKKVTKMDKYNSKILARARRVEANARERQRVHTITAAFDTLQAAIPTGEENVKLSKLSVIKIATAYIMALSRMAGHDYTVDQSAPPVQAVLEQCRQTIEAESKVKKRS